MDVLLFIMRFKYFAFLAIILLAVNSASSQTSTRDESAVISVINQLTTAQTSYNAKSLDKILTADYIEISPLGEFDPRAKVLGFYTPEAKAAAGNMSASVKVVEPSIRNYGKFAVAIVKLDYTMTNDGKPLPPRSIRATFVLKKEGKNWKIASAQYTGIRPAQPPKPN